MLVCYIFVIVIFIYLRKVMILKVNREKITFLELTSNILNRLKKLFFSVNPLEWCVL